jgi:hypothetical protein
MKTKAKTFKIIATYSHYVIDDSSDWGNKKYAHWVLVTDEHGNRIPDFEKGAMCNYGNIIAKLYPVKGERFLIEYKTGNGNAFEFPVYFKGLNNGKEFFYSYKMRELVRVGTPETQKNNFRNLPSNYQQRLESKILSLKGRFLKQDYIGLGRDSIGCIFEIEGDSIQGINRFVVSDESIKTAIGSYSSFKAGDIVTFEFKTTCYILNSIVNNLGRVLGCRSISKIIVDCKL